MLKTVLEAVGLMFMLVGFFAVCFAVLEKIFARNGLENYLTVIAGRQDDEHLPERVYAAFVETNLLSLLHKHRVVVIDYGVDPCVKSSCKRILSDENSVVFCRAEDFQNIIDRLG